MMFKSLAPCFAFYCSAFAQHDKEPIAVILSKAKNFRSSFSISDDAEIKQRCLKAWPHASHFVAALSLNMTG
jgi:hypothetical protein